jgi:dihydrofolate synthase/folylpolyglutamate synthase
MTYEETLNYLYTSTPVFQHAGGSAYKPGLDTSRALDNLLGNPHQSYRTIHVAGTNGKGSTSHLLAAVLQECGYKTGLYTSPHLVDFRERIRVNGKMIPKEYVVDFVDKYRTSFEPLRPSFFELTSTLAFDYFRTAKVDFAIIEVGLGGRLDSTNILHPLLSVITNISLDHTQFLGDTLEAIAFEKAGIIKPHVPVVIGESGSEGVKAVFIEKATAVNAPIFFAEDADVLTEATRQSNGRWRYASADFGLLDGELGGTVQVMNARTVLTVLRRLKTMGVSLTTEAVKKAFAQVVELTGLMGRWQVVHESPRVVCDTGHNTGGWEYIARQLKEEQQRYPHLHLVVGMVNDKDIHGVLSLMPVHATYYFTQAAIPRALPAADFAELARQHGLSGSVFPTVPEAIMAALQVASPTDLVFIGGSSFVVADAIPYFDNSKKQY